MNATLQILTLARSVISVSSHWTKHANARNSDGMVVDVNSINAFQFCMAGAKHHAMHSLRKEGFEEDVVVAYVLTRAAQELFPSRVGWNYTTFNDHEDTTHEDVLRVYDLAIEMAKGESHEKPL